MYRPPPSILRKSAGAFDLPSIITGVVVVGILAAGVLAAIFGVIPFAQDNGAKQDLSSIRTAEGVAKAKDNRFMDHKRLLDIGYLQLPSTKTTKVMSDEKGTCYVAIAKSGTGTLFFSTDRNTDPAILEADTETGCLSPEQLAELIADVGGIEEEEAPKEDETPKEPAVAAPANLKSTGSQFGSATATWDKVNGATGYKVEYHLGSGEWIVLWEDGTTTSASVPAASGVTVTIRVTARSSEYGSVPVATSVKIPNSLIPNPSFEQGTDSWDIRGGGTVVSNYGRSGKNSLRSSGGDGGGTWVKVTAETPILTFWSTGPAVANTGGWVRGTVVHTVETDGVWTKYKVDMSSHIKGEYQTSVKLYGDTSRQIYIDDIALEPPMVPDAPGDLRVSSRKGELTAQWEISTFIGGSAKSHYTVNTYLDGKKQASDRFPLSPNTDIVRATVGGVKLGEKYTLGVTFSNGVGASPEVFYGPVEVIAGDIANSSFEYGNAGWYKSGSGFVYNSVTDKMAHTGSKSLAIQAGTPGVLNGVTQSEISITPSTSVLTFWSTGAPSVELRWSGSSSKNPNIPKVGQDGGWTKYEMDLSAFEGRSLQITIFGDGKAFNVDDVSLGSK